MPAPAVTMPSTEPVPDAPVYTATLQEMDDLEELLATASELALRHGAVRIDPPPEWVQPPLRMSQKSKFFVRMQTLPAAPFVNTTAPPQPEAESENQENRLNNVNSNVRETLKNPDRRRRRTVSIEEDDDDNDCAPVTLERPPEQKKTVELLRGEEGTSGTQEAIDHNVAPDPANIEVEVLCVRSQPGNEQERTETEISLGIEGAQPSVIIPSPMDTNTALPAIAPAADTSVIGDGKKASTSTAGVAGASANASDLHPLATADVLMSDLGASHSLPTSRHEQKGSRDPEAPAVAIMPAPPLTLRSQPPPAPSAHRNIAPPEPPVVFRESGSSQLCGSAFQGNPSSITQVHPHALRSGDITTGVAFPNLQDVGIRIPVHMNNTQGANAVANGHAAVQARILGQQFAGLATCPPQMVAQQQPLSSAPPCPVYADVTMQRSVPDIVPQTAYQEMGVLEAPANVQSNSMHHPAVRIAQENVVQQQIANESATVGRAGVQQMPQNDLLLRHPAVQIAQENVVHQQIATESVTVGRGGAEQMSQGALLMPPAVRIAQENVVQQQIANESSTVGQGGIHQVSQGFPLMRQTGQTEDNDARLQEVPFARGRSTSTRIISSNRMDQSIQPLKPTKQHPPDPKVIQCLRKHPAFQGLPQYATEQMPRTLPSCAILTNLQSPVYKMSEVRNGTPKTVQECAINDCGDFPMHPKPAPLYHEANNGCQIHTGLQPQHMRFPQASMSVPEGSMIVGQGRALTGQNESCSLQALSLVPVCDEQPTLGSARLADETNLQQPRIHSQPPAKVGHSGSFQRERGSLNAILNHDAPHSTPAAMATEKRQQNDRSGVPLSVLATYHEPVNKEEKDPSSQAGKAAMEGPTSQVIKAETVTSPAPSEQVGRMGISLDVRGMEATPCLAVADAEQMRSLLTSTSGEDVKTVEDTQQSSATAATGGVAEYCPQSSPPVPATKHTLLVDATTEEELVAKASRVLSEHQPMQKANSFDPAEVCLETVAVQAAREPQAAHQLQALITEHIHQDPKPTLATDREAKQEEQRNQQEHVSFAIAIEEPKKSGHPSMGVVGAGGAACSGANHAQIGMDPPPAPKQIVSCSLEKQKSQSPLELHCVSSDSPVHMAGAPGERTGLVTVTGVTSDAQKKNVPSCTESKSLRHSLEAHAAPTELPVVKPESVGERTGASLRTGGALAAPNHNISGCLEQENARAPCQLRSIASQTLVVAPQASDENAGHTTKVAAAGKEIREGTQSAGKAVKEKAIDAESQKQVVRECKVRNGAEQKAVKSEKGIPVYSETIVDGSGPGPVPSDGMSTEKPTLSKEKKPRGRQRYKKRAVHISRMTWEQDENGKLSEPIMFPDSATTLSLQSYQKKSVALQNELRSSLMADKNLCLEDIRKCHGGEAPDWMRNIDVLEDIFWRLLRKGIDGKPLTVSYGVDVEAEGAFDSAGMSYVEWYGTDEKSGRIVKKERKRPTTKAPTLETKPESGAVMINGNKEELVLDAGHEGGDSNLETIREKPGAPGTAITETEIVMAGEGDQPACPDVPFDSMESGPKCHVGNLNRHGLLRHMPRMPGINHSMYYVGQLFTRFCWHVEDAFLNSVSYLHSGSAEKVWYAVPPEDASKFEDYATKTAFADSLVKQVGSAQALLMNKTTIFDPRDVRKAGVRVFRVVHRPGSFVLTAPRAYHAGFNSGFNIAEAVNFANPTWFPVGREASRFARETQKPLCVPWEYLLFHEAKAMQTRIMRKKRPRNPSKRTSKNALVLASELEKVITRGEERIREYAVRKNCRIAMLTEIDALVKNNQLGPEFGHGAGMVCSLCGHACHFYAEICGSCEDSYEARCEQHLGKGHSLCRVRGHKTVIVRRHDPVLLADVLGCLEDMAGITRSPVELLARYKGFLRTWETPARSTGLRLRMNLKQAVSRLPPNISGTKSSKEGPRREKRKRGRKPSESRERDGDSEPETAKRRKRKRSSGPHIRPVDMRRTGMFSNAIVERKSKFKSKNSLKIQGTTEMLGSDLNMVHPALRIAGNNSDVDFLDCPKY